MIIIIIEIKFLLKMNDIIDNFVNAASENYQQKTEPRKLLGFFNNSGDLENAPPINMQDKAITQNGQPSG